MRHLIILLALAGCTGQLAVIGATPISVTITDTRTVWQDNNPRAVSDMAQRYCAQYDKNARRTIDGFTKVGAKKVTFDCVPK